MLVANGMCHLFEKVQMSDSSRFSTQWYNFQSTTTSIDKIVSDKIAARTDDTYEYSPTRVNLEYPIVPDPSSNLVFKMLNRDLFATTEILDTFVVRCTAEDGREMLYAEPLGVYFHGAESYGILDMAYE